MLKCNGKYTLFLCIKSYDHVVTDWINNAIWPCIICSDTLLHGDCFYKRCRGIMKFDSNFVFVTHCFLTNLKKKRWGSQFHCICCVCYAMTQTFVNRFRCFFFFCSTAGTSFTVPYKHLSNDFKNESFKYITTLKRYFWSLFGLEL